MDALEIGEATAAEREWCARLMAESEPWITLGRSLDVLLPAALDTEYVVLVARRAGAPCGFVRIHPRGVAGSPYVASVAVAGSERGRGVGTALLDATEARYPMARYVFLCVSDFNVRARALYERHGYRLVGALPDYVVEGRAELLMAKRLACDPGASAAPDEA
jgi:ribosomal protein S18 acetylase RimI-like enzyme